MNKKVLLTLPCGLLFSGCAANIDWPIRGVSLLRIEMNGLTVHPWLLLALFVSVVGILWIRAKIRNSGKDKGEKP